MSTDADARPVVRFEPVTGDEDARLLNAVERERCERFRFPEDRASFVAAHVLVRVCAAELLGLRPEEIGIVQRCEVCDGPHGRPTVTGRPEVSVSLSHTRGYVAAAAAFSACGIDIEPLRPVEPIESVLTARERRWLAKQPDPAGVFLRLWVRKEALVKAGLGRIEALNRIDALRPGGRLTDWSSADAVGAFAIRS